MLGKITIRTTLLAMIGMLATVAVVLAVDMAYEAAGKRTAALHEIEHEITSDHLLDTTAYWARERGLIAVALAAPAAADAATQSGIDSARKEADEHYKEGVNRLKAGVVFANKDRLMAEAEAAYQRLVDMRRAVDAELKKPADQRSAELRAGAVPVVTTAIERLKAMRLASDFAGDSNDAVMAAYAQLKHNLWVISEFAGRQRALLGGHIADRRQLTAETRQTIGAYMGRIDLAIDVANAIVEHPRIAPVMKEETAAMRRTFFEEFGAVRHAVIEAGIKGGDYPLTAQEWIAAATKGVDSVLRLSDVATKGQHALSEQAAATSTRSLIVSIAVLAMIAAVSLLAVFVALVRVTRPMAAMTGAMARLANKDWSTEVPALERGDEIGQMAKAVQVFKEGGIENERLQKEAEEARIRQQQQDEEQRRLKEEAAKAEERREREAEEAKRKAAEEQKAAEERAKADAEAQRKREMQALADGFEATVKAVVETVSSSASEMQSSSTAMSATAEETSRQATAVAAASEEASANVQTVASASEELSSTIQEITRQVAESTRMTRSAVDQAKAGMTNSAPARMPVGQRAVTVLSLV
jgi:HAMP domain-containing protein